LILMKKHFLKVLPLKTNHTFQQMIFDL